MIAKFSDRIGITKPADVLQINKMSAQLRNSLWNCLLDTILQSSGRLYHTPRDHIKIIYGGFFKYPTDILPYNDSDCKKKLREIFMNPDFPWYDVYNLIEFIAKNYDLFNIFQRRDFTNELNKILEEEMSGYRFIDDELVPISNPTEIQSVSDALDSAIENNYKGLYEHLHTAIRLVSSKPKPDYRNSIKESISAVESIAMIISSEKTGGLDRALAKLDAKFKFHGGFKAGLLSLYGFTSDNDGIRHAILDEPSVGFDEAKFMLVACSALVNFLISKTTKID